MSYLDFLPKLSQKNYSAQSVKKLINKALRLQELSIYTRADQDAKFGAVLSCAVGLEKGVIPDFFRAALDELSFKDPVTCDAVEILLSALMALALRDRTHGSAIAFFEKYSLTLGAELGLDLASDQCAALLASMKEARWRAAIEQCIPVPRDTLVDYIGYRALQMAVIGQMNASALVNAVAKPAHSEDWLSKVAATDTQEEKCCADSCRVDQRSCAGLYNLQPQKRI